MQVQCTNCHGYKVSSLNQQEWNGDMLRLVASFFAVGLVISIFVGLGAQPAPNDPSGLVRLIANVFTPNELNNNELFQAVQQWAFAFLVLTLLLIVGMIINAQFPTKTKYECSHCGYKWQE